MKNLLLFFKKSKKENQKSYPLFDNADKLVCPYIRVHDVWYDSLGWWQRDWICKEKIPCRKCDFYSCHNCGKTFGQPQRLTIEKGILIN